jgi:hypothetical protein
MICEVDEIFNNFKYSQTHIINQFLFLTIHYSFYSYYSYILKTHIMFMKTREKIPTIFDL